MRKNEKLSRIKFERNEMEPRIGKPKSLMRIPEREYHPNPLSIPAASPKVKGNTKEAPRAPRYVPRIVKTGRRKILGSRSTALKEIERWIRFIPTRKSIT